MTLGGFAYAHGITFSASDGTAQAYLNVGASGALHGWYFSSCKLILGNSHASSVMRLSGTAASNSDDSYTVLDNTTVKFANASAGIDCVRNFLWKNTASAIDTDGAIPTSLFRESLSGEAGRVVVSGVDLSSIDTGNYLVAPLSTGSSQTHVFSNCKLGSGFAVKSGDIAGWSQKIILENCDSGDTNYRNELWTFGGSVVTETTIKRTGGASDGTTGFCRKVATLSSGVSFASPLRCPPIVGWNETTGSAITLEVEILHDSATNLEDDEVWLEVEYLGTSGYPLGLVADDKTSTPLTSVVNGAGNGTAQGAGTGTGNWTTTGLTNPNSQKLSVAVTPQEKGPWRATVCVAKTNYTLYYCPKVTVA
jgi:hypothetical protein